MDRRLVLTLMAAAAATSACGGMAESSTQDQAPAGGSASGLAEARALLGRQAQQSGRPAYSPSTGVRFTRQQNVFLKSALAVDFTYRSATVTLPMFEGMSPGGRPVWYIITEASDAAVAEAMGVNFAPKMRFAVGNPGAQAVTLQDGVMRFRGDVDFAPEYQVQPGPPPTYFPPASFRPGAVGDAEWSSMVVLPSDCVLNVQMVSNASGMHDRAVSIDMQARTVTMSLLDGFHDGKQYYYHLVTDVSADLPAVLEKGVFTPRLQMLGGFGKSVAGDGSTLLGFSPVLNGKTEMGSGEDQGFSTSLKNGGIDPINVFPIPPRNDDKSQRNNYSPLWDAHVSMWTPEAVSAGRVRRVTSLPDLERLVRAGDMTSAMINPPGAGNDFVAGLRPTMAIINCPVIAQPDLPPQ